ncbi:hypothetical protein KC959_00660, partial [Candidatus Saccharibacteria bacterium]|nr:hypothetical protein [Candidatus Saccharibacteria bacterium]
MTGEKITKKVTRAFAALVLMTAQMTPFFAFTPQASATNNDVTICHRTDSVTNPYVKITVNKNAVDGWAGNSGNEADHYGEHKGPLASDPATAQTLKDDKIEWGDIIPPVYQGYNYSGLNWSSDGQAIWNNDCNYPVKTTVRIIKNVIPENDPGVFDLYVGNTKVINNGGNGATHNPVEIDDRAYLRVSEKEGTNSVDFNDYTTTIVCKDENGATLQTEGSNTTSSSERYVQIDKSKIDEGDNITCTFTNTAKAGKIIVHKSIDSQYGGTTDPSEFSFTVNGGDPVAFEADGTNELVIPVGTYNIDEVEAPGYTTNTDGCYKIVVNYGDEKHCYITNTAKPVTVTVNKFVDNNWGGTKTGDEFGVALNGSTLNLESEGPEQNYESVAHFEPVMLSAGKFTITEDEVAGYTFDGIFCFVDGQSVGYPYAAKNGEAVTCNVFNNDQPATITVIKKLINDNGGTRGVSTFSFKANGGNSTFFNDNGEASVEVGAGEYNVVEDEAAGYKTSYENCSGKVTNGEEVVCVITNDDQAATVTLYKKVINNNGGHLGPLDFPLTVAGEGTFQYATSGLEIMLDAGSYVVGEVNQDGYTSLGWDWWKGDCSWNGVLKVEIGGNYTCTITNDDQPGKIIVHKEVVNNNGGRAKAHDFKFKVDNGSWKQFEHDGTNAVWVDAGWHTVVEKDADGYKASYEGCKHIYVRNGETKHCYIKNDDIAPKVTVIKWTDPVWSTQDFNFTLHNNQHGRDFVLDGHPWDDQVPNSYESGPFFEAGWVRVEEEPVEGWDQLWTSCFVKTRYGLKHISHPFKAELGEEYVCKVMNQQRGGIVVTKFYDTNENGVWDEGEETLEDWEMNVSSHQKECEVELMELGSVQANSLFYDGGHEEENDCDEDSVALSQLTDEQGEANFNNLKPGVYQVNETLQDGWVQSGIYCPREYKDELSLNRTFSEDSDEETENIAYAHVQAGQTVHCYVGNYEPR